jgi:hypothetical protein
MRNDWLASAELTALGMHLERVESIASSASFLREVRKLARSNSASNRTGHLWELVAASMFNEPTHPVELPKSNNPGFDFTLCPPEGPRVRVSCKALNPSDNELAFRDFAVELEASVAGLARVGQPVQLIFGRQNATPAALDADSCMVATREILGRPDGAYSANGWLIVKRRLTRQASRFYFKEASHSVTVMSEYPADEQRRFASMVERTLDNLTQHCSPPSSGTTNAALIKVPAPISIGLAEDTIRTLFDSSSLPHLAGILLYRTQVLSQGPDVGGFLAHEYRQIANPHAATAFPPLAFNVPVGLFATTEPQHRLLAGEQSLELSNMFVYTGGRLVYEGIPKIIPTGEEFRFEVQGNRLEATVIVFERPGGGTARVDAPAPDAWTVIV